MVIDGGSKAEEASPHEIRSGSDRYFPVCSGCPLTSCDRTPVKKSQSGICHEQGTSLYKRTQNFEPFDSLEKCLASGGRRPANTSTRGEKPAKPASHDSWLSGFGGKALAIAATLLLVGGAYWLFEPQVFLEELIQRDCKTSSRRSGKVIGWTKETNSSPAAEITASPARRTSPTPYRPACTTNPSSDTRADPASDARRSARIDLPVQLVDWPVGNQLAPAVPIHGRHRSRRDPVHGDDDVVRERQVRIRGLDLLRYGDHRHGNHIRFPRRFDVINALIAIRLDHFPVPLRPGGPNMPAFAMSSRRLYPAYASPAAAANGREHPLADGGIRELAVGEIVDAAIELALEKIPGWRGLDPHGRPECLP